MTNRHEVARFDLEGYIQRRGARPAARGNWALDCPICGKEGKLVVNVDRRAWHCWVCEEYTVVVGPDGKARRKPLRGAGGLLDLIEVLEGCTRERARQIVSQGSGVAQGMDLEAVLAEDPDLDYLETAGSSVQPAQPIPPPEGWRPMQYAHAGVWAYLGRRGISPEDVAMFGIFWCETGRYSNRIVFPIWERGQMVYYQARAAWDNPGTGKYLKSLNPPAHPGMAGAGDVLMNLDQARHYPRVAIVEGPVDCVHAGPSAVCTFGKRISATQVLKLAHAGVRALDFMWDGPGPTEPYGAWPEMVKASAQLAGLFDVRLVFLPKGDPGEYSRAELDGFRAQARPANTISRLAML